MHHHAIGALVAEFAPLDKILAEGGERLLSILALAKIAGSKASERILLGELMDRRGGGIRLDRARNRWIREITATQRGRETSQLARALDTAKRKCGAPRRPGTPAKEIGRTSCRERVCQSV